MSSKLTTFQDITIRIRMQDTDIKAAGEEMEKFAASSAGILCWSTSASDHSKSSTSRILLCRKLMAVLFGFLALR
jgi:hypothetical protein